MTVSPSHYPQPHLLKPKTEPPFGLGCSYVTTGGTGSQKMDTAAMIRVAQNGHPWPPLYGHHTHNALARSAPAVLQKGPAFPHNAMLAEMPHLPFRVPAGKSNRYPIFEFCLVGQPVVLIKVSRSFEYHIFSLKIISSLWSLETVANASMFV